MKTGCKFLKADGAMLRPTRLRPLVLQHIAAIRTWRLPARSAKVTSSKKGLLLEEKASASVAMATTVICNTYGLKVCTKPKNRLNHVHAQPKLQAQPDHDDHDHDHDQGRIIGPGSPSFRIFFEDAARDAHLEQIGKNEALKETNSPPDVGPSKERSEQKNRKMRRHIKSVVLAKRREAEQALKDLLNVKASHRPNTLPVAHTTTSN